MALSFESLISEKQLLAASLADIARDLRNVVGEDPRSRLLGVYWTATAAPNWVSPRVIDALAGATPVSLFTEGEWAELVTATLRLL
jgi:hypothetical protein